MGVGVVVYSGVSSYFVAFQVGKLEASLESLSSKQVLGAEFRVLRHEIFWEDSHIRMGLPFWGVQTRMSCVVISNSLAR